MDGFELDLSQVFQGIDFASERIKEAAKRGMTNAMEDLLSESQRIAPKLKGDLRQSGRIEVVVSNGSIKGTVSYSMISKSKRGWAFDYALRMHEYPGKFTNPSTPGTGPKFLSRPLKAKQLKYEEMIADEIRKELSG